MSPRDIAGETFRALRVRNYRLFAASQLVSLSGAWMQTVAQSWLVLRLSDSGVALGVVTALQFLPTAIGGMWGGLIADRLDKRRVLIATQAAAAVQAAALAVATLTGHVTVELIGALALLWGIATAVDMPTRQSFVTELVGPENVANAVGLNSAVFNVARLIGPAIAGVLIATAGEGAAFAVNAVTFLPVIWCLVRLDKSELHRTKPLARGRGQLREGLRYAWRSPVIRRTLSVMAVVATLGMNFQVVGPMLARFTFGAGARGYAMMTAFVGGGALVGALATARRARPTQRLLIATAAGFGASALATSMAPTLLSASLLFTLVGATAMAFIATVNSTLQLACPARLRGRIMAIYAIVFLGASPVGSPLVGWVAERFGARTGLALGGVAAIVAAVVAWLSVERERARPAAPRGAPAAPLLADAVAESA